MSGQYPVAALINAITGGPMTLHNMPKRNTTHQTPVSYTHLTLPTIYSV